MNRSRHRSPLFPRFAWWVQLVAVLVVPSACRNEAVVGRRHDGGAVDASLHDASRDASDDAGSNDAGPDDAGSTDGAVVDAGLGDCAPPWVAMVARASDATSLVRFSLAHAEPVRCADLLAEGTLPPSTIDVEALSAERVVAVGPDAIVAIDVATDSVAWRVDGVADAVDAQAFVVRSDPPWMGVAWWLESSRVGRITGTSASGDDTRTWDLSVPIVGVSAHADPRYAYASSWDRNLLHVFAPFSRTVVDDVSLRPMYKPHVIAGEPPRIAGGGRTGAIRMGTLDDPSNVIVRVIEGCDPREAAPHPGDSDEVIVRCGEPSVALLANVATGDTRVLLGPGPMAPELDVRGLGIFE